MTNIFGHTWDISIIPVFVHCTQGSASDFGGLYIMALVPHLLKNLVIHCVKVMTFENGVKVTEIRSVKCHL